MLGDYPVIAESHAPTQGQALRDADFDSLQRGDEVWIRGKVMTANPDRIAVAPYGAMNVGTVLVSGVGNLRRAPAAAPAISDDDFKEEYYGYKCSKCDLFFAYGYAPWEDTE